jgi:hypothetical protein
MRVPWRRMTGAVLGPIAPYGDVGHVEIVAEEHAYLLCWPCGVPLYLGRTTEDATVYVCHSCRRITDTRRVD